MANRDASAKPRPDNLHQPRHDLRERVWRPKVREQSLAVAAQMRPAATAGLALALVAVIGAGVVVGLKLRRRLHRPRA
jgi:hypothetical protein